MTFNEFLPLLFMGVMGFIFPGVDNAAHLGGFIGGYLTSLILDPLKKERIDGRLRKDMFRLHRCDWISPMKMSFEKHRKNNRSKTINKKKETGHPVSFFCDVLSNHLF